MSAQSSTVTINFTKDGKEFTRTFSGLKIDNIGTKETAKTKFIDKYKGIVDGTPETYDFSVVEKGIEY